MEQKKTLQADMEQRRTTGFLLGLVFVLAVCYVSLEWSSADAVDEVEPIDLDELMHESELVPMENLETVTQLQEKQLVEKAEQLNVVDDAIEQQETEELLEGEGEEDADDFDFFVVFGLLKRHKSPRQGDEDGDSAGMAGGEGLKQVAIAAAIKLI